MPAVRVLDTHPSLYEPGVVGLSKKGVVELVCGALRFKTEDVEVLEALERGRRSRFLHSGREQSEPQELCHYVKLPLTAAEVELYVMNPVCMDYDETMATCGDRKDAGFANRMA